MRAAGLSVPPWICVPAGIFEAVAGKAIDLYHRGLAGLRAEEEETIRALCQESEEAARRAIEADVARGKAGSLACVARDAVRRLNAPLLAARSSALSEDGRDSSYAGQFESILDVDPRNAGEAVARCWLAYFKPGLARYRLGQGGPGGRGMAVLLQEMVRPSFSGVAFSVDPRGDMGSILIDAVPGRSENLMRGETAPERWSVERRSLRARLEQARAEGRVLDDRLAARLARLCLRAEGALGTWVDFEWAYDGEFRALQARPITALPRGPLRMLDNGNIVESYPGISSPLSFSFARHAYSAIFANLTRRIGLGRGVSARRGESPRPMIERFMGRIYYDLQAWYDMYSRLPLASRFIPLWEKMMGIPPTFSRPAERTSPAGRLAELERSLLILTRTLIEFARMPSSAAALLARFDRTEAAFLKAFSRDMDSAKLKSAYLELCRRMLDGWELTLLNDGYAFIGAALARKAIRAVVGGVRASEVFNGLLCGFKGVESMEPLRGVLRMAGIISFSPALTARALAAPGEKAVRLEVPPDCGTRELSAADDFNAALETYLARYGARSPEELKLETPSYAEAPWILIGRVGAYAAAGLIAEDMQERERAVRVRVEASLNPGWKAFLLKPIVRAAIRMAGRAIAFREASRMARGRFFRMARMVFIAAGRRLAEAGRLDQAEDVFYLEEDEVLDALDLDPRTADLRTMIARRRDADKPFHGIEAPERVLWKGDLEDAQAWFLSVSDKGMPGRLPSDSDAVRGLGCSPGRARGMVLVVSDPETVLDAKGRILVARSTDPGWIFIMAEAAGLIVEKGSLLSHSAIVGRELGLPTIVGAEGVLEAFRTGDTVEMDGATGEARILGRGG